MVHNFPEAGTSTHNRLECCVAWDMLAACQGSGGLSNQHLELTRARYRRQPPHSILVDWPARRLPA
jgi:hypothetical protein